MGAWFVPIGAMRHVAVVWWVPVPPPYPQGHTISGSHCSLGSGQLSTSGLWGKVRNTGPLLARCGYLRFIG